MREVLGTIFGRRILPLGTYTTPTPESVVWIDNRTNGMRDPNPPTGYYEIFLADSNHFTSGDSAFDSPPYLSEITQFAFRVFPRREREINMDFFYYDNGGHGRFCTNISFPNPLFKNYPVWQAENLPAKKRVGDVEVTLLSMETAHDNSSNTKASRDGSTKTTYGTNRVDGRNYTVVNLSIKPLGNTNEVWWVEGLDISDATGNSSHSTTMSWNGNDAEFEFMPGLWPGEAWKLKLFLKRTAGFRQDELFSFTNVPLGEMDHTNVLAWSTNIAGLSVTLDSVCRRAPQTNGSWSSALLSTARFTHSAVPPGTNMELVEAIFGPKTNQSVSSESSDNYHQYHFLDIPTAAKTADFTFAIQQLRTVEFIVMPELPKPELKTEK